jgi:hypothetical protein
MASIAAAPIIPADARATYGTVPPPVPVPGLNPDKALAILSSTTLQSIAGVLTGCVAK